MSIRHEICEASLRQTGARGRTAISLSNTFTFDFAKDGRRFLLNCYVKPDRVDPLTVVLNAAKAVK